MKIFKTNYQAIANDSAEVHHEYLFLWLTYQKSTVTTLHNHTLINFYDTHQNTSWNIKKVRINVSNDISTQPISAKTRYISMVIKPSPLRPPPRLAPSHPTIFTYNWLNFTLITFVNINHDETLVTLSGPLYA